MKPLLQAKTMENTLETLYLETGDLSAFPLTYLQGREPLKEEEIALSVLSADSLQKKIGEKSLSPQMDSKFKKWLPAFIKTSPTEGKQLKHYLSLFLIHPFGKPFKYN